MESLLLEYKRHNKVSEQNNLTLKLFFNMKSSLAIFILTAFLSLLSGCNNDNTAKQTAPTNSPSTKESTQQTAPTNSPSAEKSGGVTKVSVLEKEMEIQLSPATVPAGEIEFIAKNEGKIPHEMVVIKTDLPLDKLPLKNGRLDEDKAGQKIGEIESDELKSGANKSLRLKLAPGKYLIQCNIPGHFTSGMKAQLTVQ